MIPLGLFPSQQATSPPSTVSDLPYMGLYYGTEQVTHAHGETHLTITSERGVSVFFYSERSGVIDRVRFNARRRTTESPGSYSAGDGGKYTIEVRRADASTKLPMLGVSAISKVDNWHPDTGVDTGYPHRYPQVNFTQTGAVQAKQPYCIIWRNTHASPTSNFFSINTAFYYNYKTDNPPNAGPPPGGWSPCVFDGKTWFPYPTTASNGTLRRRIGPAILDWRYSDGVWCGNSFVAPGQIDSDQTPISGDNMLRERFRVTRATRVVSGLFLYVWRLNGSGGNLVVSLESGPGSDTSGNGSVVETVSVPAGSITNSNGSFSFNEVLHNPPIIKLPWLWVPFDSPRTLALGQIYNLRLSASGGYNGRSRRRQRAEHAGSQWSPVSSSWAEHEARRTLAWNAFDDSRGVQFSNNGGGSWSYVGGNLRESMNCLFKCVVT